MLINSLQGRTMPSAGWIVRESLKFKTREAADVDIILHAAPIFHQYAHTFPFSRKDVGNAETTRIIYTAYWLMSITGGLMRKTGHLWRLAFMLAATHDLMAGSVAADDPLTGKCM